MIAELIKLYMRDLDRLNEEILAYPNELDLWKIDSNIKNSGGNLALHIIGNLNHFIGATLGRTAYVRARDNEFKNKNIPRQTITDSIFELKTTLKKALSYLIHEDLNKNYPLEVFGKPMSTEYFLIHLYGHLNYHLGQINYHRRLLG